MSEGATTQAERRRPHYQGGTPSQAALLERRKALRTKYQRSMAQVTDLARSQRELSTELGNELSQIRAQADLLDDLDLREAESGLLAALTRAFARRRAILQRRSVAEGLLQRYETASQCLRRASAFSDELRLCALELQQQVDELHAELAKSEDNRLRAAEAVVSLDDAIAEMEDGPTAIDDGTRARKLDEYQFRQRSEALALELFQAAEELTRGELPPARALRDTVVELHEEMARFVLGAESAINTAGRRIQALGMAADAPTVVAELQTSMAELGAAMEATERYVEQAQHLLTHVLPELNAEMAARAKTDNDLLVDDLDAISRERSRALAEQALKDAARAEVESVTRRL
jgi:hypothetical protein